MANEVTFETLKSVKDAADFLKLLSGTNDLTRLETPINISALLNKIDLIEYSEEPSFEYFDKSGYIKVIRAPNGDPRKIKIWCNPAESDTRKRFTAGHELGHLVFDILPNIDKSNAQDEITDTYHRDEQKGFVEMRANRFSGQLLMPAQLVSSKLQKLISLLKKENRNIGKHEIIDKLASVFSVSRDAMGMRLKTLGYIKSF